MSRIRGEPYRLIDARLGGATATAGHPAYNELPGFSQSALIVFAGDAGRSANDDA